MSAEPDEKEFVRVLNLCRMYDCDGNNNDNKLI